MSDLLQSPGAQSGITAGEHSPVTQSVENPTTGITQGSVSTPVMQPHFDLDSPEG